jgi:hypothetical protein
MSKSTETDSDEHIKIIVEFTHIENVLLCPVTDLYAAKTAEHHLGVNDEAIREANVAKGEVVLEHSDGGYNSFSMNAEVAKKYIKPEWLRGEAVEYIVCVTNYFLYMREADFELVDPTKHKPCPNCVMRMDDQGNHRRMCNVRYI